uniref:Uncharacterized protein n=1 Tax=Babesia bovis TaxID=5865 RepID=S6B8N7_BABBO|nr:hypothetical protein [Babesia bovis]
MATRASTCVCCRRTFVNTPVSTSSSLLLVVSSCLLRVARTRFTLLDTLSLKRRAMYLTVTTRSLMRMRVMMKMTLDPLTRSPLLRGRTLERVARSNSFDTSESTFVHRLLT